jgi:hypothetical protein
MRVGAMIRVCLLIFTFFVPTVLLAEMSDVRRNTLINICDAAQKSSDLGTIRTIANQLKNADRPSDLVLSKKYDECLLIAFGKSKASIDIDPLLKKINETAAELHDDCRTLLNASPEVAINNPICKGILIK